MDLSYSAVLFGFLLLKITLSEIKLSFWTKKYFAPFSLKYFNPFSFYFQIKFKKH